MQISNGDWSKSLKNSLLAGNFISKYLLAETPASVLLNKEIIVVVSRSVASNRNPDHRRGISFALQRRRDYET